MTSTRLTRSALWLGLALISGCELERMGGAVSAAHDAGVDAGAGGQTLDDAAFGGGAGHAEAETATPLPYAFRRRLVLTPGASGVPKGASLRFAIDHQALVLASKSRADGKDLRLFHQSGGQSQEIHRVLDLASAWGQSDTTLWFRVQAPIGPEPGGIYYLYYGDPLASEPQADPHEVYAAFDDFDGTGVDPAWNGQVIGNAKGTFTVQAGMLRIEGTTGDIWNNADDFLFLARSLSGNFVAEARVAAAGGSASGWAKLGGLMLRANAAKGSVNRMIAPVNGSAAITSSFRLTTAGGTDEQAQSGAKLIPRVVRLARRYDSTWTWHSAAAVDYAELGSEQVFASALPDTVLVGLPLANLVSAPGWVEIDWFRAWLWYDHEPSLAFEPEEPGPFLP